MFLLLAVNANAHLAKIHSSLSVVHSASATTSRVTVKTESSALATEDVNATVAVAMKAGVEALASAAHQPMNARTLKERSVQGMESAFADAANAKRTKTADTRANFVKSAQLAPIVVLS